MSSILKKFAAAAVLLSIALPVYASPPSIYAPVCQSNSSDSDGDGWGWENSQTCVITNARASQRAYPICRQGTEDPDRNGWGYQGGVSCLIINAYNNTCEYRSSDSDGDGFGFENGQSCTVDSTSKADGSNQVITTPSTPNTEQSTDNFVVRGDRTFPVCEFANSDTDGNGWGWENSDSCVVTTISKTEVAPAATPIVPKKIAPIISGKLNACHSSLSDDDGDGFGFEGGRSCTVTSNSPAFPICLSVHSDFTGSGYGFENGSTCLAVEGISSSRDNLLLATPMCDSWVEIAYGNYRMENNTWNSAVMLSDRWSQCIELNLINNRPVASWTFDWLREQDGDSGEVKSYPQVYYGRKAERRVSGTFEELGLPQITNRLPEFSVDYSWSFNGNAENNVALESFFHETCEAENNNKEYEMMVWVGVPKIRTPGVFVTTATVDGKRWRVYANPFVSQGYVAFVAEQPSFSGTLNWNRFIEWSRANSSTYGLGELRPNSCMGAIEIGTETFWGKGEFTLHQFDVRVK